MTSKSKNHYNRSVKCYFTKFLNKGKKEKLSILLNEYTRVCNEFIESLWIEYKEGNKIKSQFNKIDQPIVNTLLSARLLNSCVNQASSIVRSRIEQIKEFSKRSVQKPHTLEKLLICPKLEKNEMRIDSKNSSVSLNTKISFDLIVELKCLGIVDKFEIPLRKNSVFNKWNLLGKLLNGIIVRDNYIQFCFNIQIIEKSIPNKVLGVDIGTNCLYSTSEGYQAELDHQLFLYKQLLEKIHLQVYKSRSHEKAILQLRNHIRYMVKQIDFSLFTDLHMERLDFTNFKHKFNNICKFWNYSYILDVLTQYAESQNVFVTAVLSYYTSQRCHECGYVNKSNRKGDKFICLCCWHSSNADINAAKNISLDLFRLPRQVNQLKDFFWWPDRWAKAQDMQAV